MLDIHSNRKYVCASPKSVVEVTGLTINISFKEEFYNLHDPTTIKFTQPIERATYERLKGNHTNLLNVEVTHLQPGSVKVTLRLSFDTHDVPDTSVIVNGVGEVVKRGDLPGEMKCFMCCIFLYLC